MLFLFSLNQIVSLKGYWAHTRFSPIHVVVVEVARRIHTEHVSITAVKVIRRHNNSPIKQINQSYYNMLLQLLQIIIQKKKHCHSFKYKI